VVPRFVLVITAAVGSMGGEKMAGATGPSGRSLDVKTVADVAPGRRVVLSFNKIGGKTSFLFRAPRGSFKKTFWRQVFVLSFNPTSKSFCDKPND